MADEKSALQEFKLDPDCELRFEVESKNEKVTLEVNIKCSFLSYVQFNLLFFTLRLIKQDLSNCS